MTKSAVNCPFRVNSVAPILNTFYQHLDRDESVLVKQEPGFPHFQEQVVLDWVG